MPVIVPNNLPACSQLAKENIHVIEESRATSQDIRPLKLLILNLMPTKVETETQLIRVLSHSPLQIDVTFVYTKTYQSKTTPPQHLKNFYTTFDQVKDTYFDGMIITGAPVEHLDFTTVAYWDELESMMAWSKIHVYSTLHICWGAQAGLFHHYGVKKIALDEKMSGIYLHETCEQNHPLLRGFNDVFDAPHSRYTTISRDDVKGHEELDVLAKTTTGDLYLIAAKNLRQVFLTGHPEYDTETLNKEFVRDVDKGINPAAPVNYFTDGDENLPIRNTWRAHATLLFTNWIHQIYQDVPYEIGKISEIGAD